MGEVNFSEASRVVMKIDVEGFEGLAMEGAKEYLTSKNKPQVVYSEFAPFMIETASQAIGESVEVSKRRSQMYLDQFANAGYTHSNTFSLAKPLNIYEVVFTRK